MNMLRLCIISTRNWVFILSLLFAQSINQLALFYTLLGLHGRGVRA